MTLADDAETILANAYAPIDPETRAATARRLIAHGGADLLPMLDLEDFA